VTKTQPAGPISCLEHHTTRVLHCTTVTRAAVLMFPLLFQTIISNRMRPYAEVEVQARSNGLRSACLAWCENTQGPEKRCIRRESRIPTPIRCGFHQITLTTCYSYASMRNAGGIMSTSRVWRYLSVILLEVYIDFKTRTVPDLLFPNPCSH